MRILLCLVMLTLATCAQNPSDSVPSAIKQVLQKQQDAWNRHDLDTFMS